MPTAEGSRDDEEQRLVDMIIEYAQLKHVLVMHPRPAMTKDGWRTAIQGDEGYLDLTLAGPGGVAFAECKKRVGGKVSDGQVKWLDTLCAAQGSHHVYLWTMEHWDDGEIRAVIDMLARVPMLRNVPWRVQEAAAADARPQARASTNPLPPRSLASPRRQEHGQELVASAAPLPTRPTVAPRTPPPASGAIGYEPDVELANGEHIRASVARTLNLPLASGELPR